MALDYRVFKSSEPSADSDKRQNYFDFNPHLAYLIRRASTGDPELVQDILKMIGELSAQHLAPRADANDKAGCRLKWHVGDVALSQSEFKKFNELKGTAEYRPEEPASAVDKALQAASADPEIPIYSDVVLPPGAVEQMNLLREHDLIGIALPETYGGTSLSHMVNGAALLFYSQADAALLLRVMLTEGVAELIEHFADDALKDKYLPLLCSGDPGNHHIGAMLITEPDAGSDLRGIAVKAVKKDGRYFIGGRKIFITNPDADVSIVLARMDGAAHASLEGLSLFLVPKFIVDETENRKRNRILIENLEEKLGIHASPTGSVFFKGAHAHLIGREGEGLKQMLYLMNKSRLGIGIQGLGIAERAFLESAVFCTERKQFGKILAELPLMQEILASMRIEIEGATSFIFKAYDCIDRYFALNNDNQETDSITPENGELRYYQKLIRILTPLAKYHGSRLGVSMADRAVSNFGGYGYINEFKVERLIRDAKIATIYEGTNNMMVLDVQRSIVKEGTLEVLIEDMQANLKNVKEDLLLPSKELTNRCVSQLHAVRKTIMRSPESDIAAQVEARKFAEFLIHVYQAGLMLEEAQHQMDSEGDLRKAVMAIKFSNDTLLPPGERITAKNLSVKFFNSIFYHQKLSYTDYQSAVACKA